MFTPVDVPFPGVSSTQAFGISSHGQIVGEYRDSSGTHGFLDDHGVFTPIDVPFAGASSTQPYGINPGGQVVGSYLDSGCVDGFLATP